MAEGADPTPASHGAGPAVAARTESSPAPAASSSGFQLPPRLALRTASTASSAPKTAHPVRRGSILSDFSIEDAHHTLRSSTDSFLLPRPSRDSPGHVEPPSHWHSTPLVFALLPAIAGLVFQNGSAFTTDLLLLGLAAIFLNWSVRLPWKWYYDARSIQVKEDPLMFQNGIAHSLIIEENSEEEDEDAPITADQPPDGAKLIDPFNARDHSTLRKEAAAVELRRHELLALLSCFVGPVFSAYLLHVIRAQLSRPSEGLVSDYNLTIFLLMAELRPCAHLVKLLQARTLYLQRFIQATDHGSDPSGTGTANDAVRELGKRLDEIESSLTASMSKPYELKDVNRAESDGLTQAVRQSLQPQLDALNRAVRRYEKRATTQTMVTEARLQDLELRLQDALSLAAAAAQSSQKSSAMGIVLSRLSQLLVYALQVFSAVCLFPLRVLFEFLTKLKIWLFGSYKKKKGQSRLEHVNTGIARLHTKSAKR